jgi:hypothetical protein
MNRRGTVLIYTKGCFKTANHFLRAKFYKAGAQVLEVGHDDWIYYAFCDRCFKSWTDNVYFPGTTATLITQQEYETYEVLGE